MSTQHNIESPAHDQHMLYEKAQTLWEECCATRRRATVDALICISACVVCIAYGFDVTLWVAIVFVASCTGLLTAVRANKIRLFRIKINRLPKSYDRELTATARNLAERYGEVAPSVYIVCDQEGPPFIAPLNRGYGVFIHGNDVQKMPPDVLLGVIAYGIGYTHHTSRWSASPTHILRCFWDMPTSVVSWWYTRVTVHLMRHGTSSRRLLRLYGRHLRTMHTLFEWFLSKTELSILRTEVHVADLYAAALLDGDGVDTVIRTLQHVQTHFVTSENEQTIFSWRITDPTIEQRINLLVASRERVG